MRKQLVNFRLSQEIIYLLSLLKQNLHASKTAVVEKSLKAYADEQLINTNSLLAFAGSVDETTTEDMLHAIRTSRRNKNKISIL